MRILYLQCSHGICEERLLAALVDAGVDPASIAEALGAEASPFLFAPLKGEISATSIELDLDRSSPFATAPDLCSYVQASSLSPRLQRALLDTVHRLEQFEADGFRDAVAPEALYLLAACAEAMHGLEIDIVHASPLPLNPGQDSPFLARAAVGVQVYHSADVRGWNSVVGVTFLGCLADNFGLMPSLRVDAVGAGLHLTEDKPLAPLQVWIGSAASAQEAQEISILETNIDDMPAQGLEYVMSRLLDKGALDVYFTPIQMKKNRPAVMVTTLCRPENIEVCLEILLQETTTLGIRVSQCSRRCLERMFLEVETLYGKVPVKAAILGGVVRSVMPEYDNCRLLASQHGAPLSAIQDAATNAAWQALRAQGWRRLGGGI